MKKRKKDISFKPTEMDSRLAEIIASNAEYVKKQNSAIDDLVESIVSLNDFHEAFSNLASKLSSITGTPDNDRGPYNSQFCSDLKSECEKRLRSWIIKEVTFYEEDESEDCEDYDY